MTDSGPASCMFQDLVEWVVGMKLSIIAKNEDFCVSVSHPSSGKFLFRISNTRVLLTNF